MLKSNRKRGPAWSFLTDCVMRVGMPGAFNISFDMVIPFKNSNTITLYSGK